jgi:hypothetical protein
MLASFFGWLVLIAVLGGIVFWGFHKLRPVREVLLPMWLPLSVMIVAGVALFGTEQGRDLGTGVLGNGQWQLVLLALALFYWATGSWHAARLGLNRRFGSRTSWPAGYEPWLRWLPKLLGACAHLFAAVILTLAARHVIPPDSKLLLFVPLWLIGYVPPAVIIVGVFTLWWHDQRYVAARDGFTQLEAAGHANQAAREAFAAAKQSLNRAIWLTIVIGLAIGVVLYLLGDRLPKGLAPATGWVLISAASFLLVVSYRKGIGRWVLSRRSVSDRVKSRLLAAFEETDARHALSSTVLAGSLTVVAVLVAGWAWWDPVSLGTAAGSMVLGFFAFGAYIAVIDLIRILSGTDAKFAAVCVFLLLLAAGTSATRDFHRVRLCGDRLAPCPGASAAAGTWIDHRPTVDEAAETWYAQASEGWPEARPVPMLIVATAGGGIRAAYWTATVLEQLGREVGNDVLRRHLFAISGVSGGSVGALAYMASTADDAASDRSATKLLDRDFLAPAVAAMAFVDGPSSFLPDFRQGDRGYALERAWEVASGEVLARPFLSFFPSKDGLRSGAPWRPALVLNATHQGTGRRVITSHLQVEQKVFLDSFDAHALVKVDMPASTAGHNSARFSYVSPAGKLVPARPENGGPRDFGFLLDGGYFENFGAMTALQLLREARQAIGPDKVRPIILQISSDPALSARDRARMDRDASLCEEKPGSLLFQVGDGGDWMSSYANELTAPIAGVLATRVAHGTLASQELAHAICQEQHQEAPRGIDDLLAKQGPSVAQISAPNPGGLPRPDERPHYAHLAMCDEDGSTVPPLGWVLSPLVRGQFLQILEHQCGNKEELKGVVDAFLRPGI